MFTVNLQFFVSVQTEMEDRFQIYTKLSEPKVNNKSDRCFVRTAGIISRTYKIFGGRVSFSDYAEARLRAVPLSKREK